MNTEALLAAKNEAEAKMNRIGRLLNDKQALEKTINDIEYLQHHAGGMLFTGSSGKIGEGGTTLRTVKINLLGGCVAVPELLKLLAGKKLKAIEAEEVTILNT